MRIFEMSDQGLTIFSFVWLLNHTPTTPHSVKPNSNQETAAGGGGEHAGVTGSFTGRYQLKGSTHGNILPPIMKPPAVDRVLSRDLPSMATHSCPYIIQLLFSLKKKKNY